MIKSYQFHKKVYHEFFGIGHLIGYNSSTGRYLVEFGHEPTFTRWCEADTLFEYHAVEKDAQAAIDTVLDFDRVLGVLKETKEMPQETVALTEKYRKARKAGDYAASDKIRAEIESQGITVKDNPDGSTSLSAPSMTIKIIK